mmetsp:Transcript_2873/g.4322  ORF Transcript_2873/g.4322 Transcript_2873/m.4322 type:complete len:128 (+) Transcript_2873:2197-2580(+)|eukprot:CAMPEP_0171462136 /NCGR_PEP_ID=MMETSP0945-20130129/6299_1 /TAXON_ID=109269 /ORGANISM="Vaucheria litorea, Strain CCMP2940" /LENGTH=127 /DNA_ID=CAMNT_0011988611 /DNA_START=2189 /DNA_END=2572 /DNA_ORIENTATION=-
MAKLRAALVYSSVLKKTLAAEDASENMKNLDPVSVSLATKILRDFIESGGIDTEECLASIFVYVEDSTLGSAPNRIQRHTPALLLALDFLLERHELLLRTLKGEAKYSRINGEICPGFYLCELLKDL